MEFYKIASADKVIDYTGKRVSELLESGKKVLWLLSGGSAIALEIEIAKRLAKAKGLESLAVSLIDERFGPIGHPDSNWQQLLDKGFELPRAQLNPVLKGENMTDTAQDFEVFLETSFDKCDFSLAIAGIGPDGHTLGIKPDSPALNTGSLVSAYDWEDYRRITSTEQVIKKLDEIVVAAFGAEKREQLLRLRQDLPASEQPAQLLKRARRAIIFNDQTGENWNG